MSSWGWGLKFSNLQQLGDFSICGSKSSHVHGVILTLKTEVFILFVWLDFFKGFFLISWLVFHVLWLVLHVLYQSLSRPISYRSLRGLSQDLHDEREAQGLWYGMGCGLMGWDGNQKCPSMFFIHCGILEHVNIYILQYILKNCH